MDLVNYKVFSKLQGTANSPQVAGVDDISHKLSHVCSQYVGSNGPKKFTIKRLGTIDSLPCAHTW